MKFIVIILILSLIFIDIPSFGQAAQAPAPTAPADAAADAQDRNNLDAQLLVVQVNALKDFTLQLQKEIKRLTEENKKLKAELDALKKPK